MDNIVQIGDKPVTLKDFINVVMKKYNVELTQSAIDRINKSRDVVDKIVNEKQVKYGISTGFGSLCRKTITGDELDTLQSNLIRSHAVGVGKICKKHIARGMLFLRLVCIANGNSGVRLCLANTFVEAINKGFCPLIPKVGSVGASGDLCPLSHLVLGLMGEGLAYDEETNEYINALEVLKKLKMEPITLKAKEGLAMNNGTQFITTWTALALYEALRCYDAANLIAAVSVEALHGVHNAFDPRIHQVKPHNGQIHVANKLWKHLRPNGEPSEIFNTYCKDKVQDAYSLRCIPQIHGTVYDLLHFVKKIVETEMNSSNDNPLVFDNDIISGGNFHGMYIGMAADQIAYAMTILCNNSERRLERMVNHSLNGFMPSCLAPNAGLNSGLMIVQYAAAAVTAENRQLANPGSVHSIPTCEGSEDIVSMAAWPARKAYKSTNNTYDALAFELFTAFQALGFTKEKPSNVVQKLYTHIKETLKVPQINNDCYMKPYIDSVNEYIHSEEFDYLV
jgi:histidine ammonia-lyase